MKELTYTRCGDYYIPDLKLSEQPEAPIGKYGRMRQRYLKERRPGLYSSLILSEKLYPHLLETDRGGAGAYGHHTSPHDGGGGSYRGIESPRPYAVGGADEYAESTGRGIDTVRTDFQLNLRIEAAYVASVHFITLLTYFLPCILRDKEI